MRKGGGLNPNRQLVRIAEGLRGSVELRISVCPRFDYGEVRPWIRQHGIRMFSAIGGNDALFVTSDANIEPAAKHDLAASFSVRSGERIRLSMQKSQCPIGLKFQRDAVPARTAAKRKQFAGRGRVNGVRIEPQFNAVRIVRAESAGSDRSRRGSAGSYQIVGVRNPAELNRLVARRIKRAAGTQRRPESARRPVFVVDSTDHRLSKLIAPALADRDLRT